MQATGIDARLIEAEARLRASDIAGMMTILNALRTSPQTIGIFKIAAMAALALYRAVSTGDYKKAGIIQRIIAPAAGAVTTKYGIPGLKCGMELEGFQPGLPRRPKLPLGQTQREDLQQTFRRMNSELAELS